MIKKIKLLIKFLIKAVKTNVYLCNRIVTKLIVNEKLITLKETFIKVKSFINYIHI